MLNKGIKRILAAVLLAVVLLGQAFSVSADAKLNDAPYTSYSFWQNGTDKRAVADRDVFAVSKILDGKSLGISSFVDITDLDSDDEGNLYVLDSGKKTIYKLDKEQKIADEVSEFVLDGEKTELANPQGLFVDGDNLFICDTDNQRVLLCDFDGRVKKVYTRPESDIIPADLSFQPIRVARDKKGFLYILLKGSYYGAVTYDEKDSFIGFFGSNTVQTSGLEAIEIIFDRMFPNTENAMYKEQKLPFQFVDLSLDNNDFLYTVSPNSDTAMGQIRKLSPTGINILSYRTGSSAISADTLNFSDDNVYVDNRGEELSPNFISISVDDRGFIYALDSAYGRIYVYDGECNSITVFGNGLGDGDQKGSFAAATAIEAVGGKVFVSDSVNKNITVFDPTNYGSLLMDADIFTLKGDYENALPIWEEVLTLSRNNQLCYCGIAKAKLQSGDYSEALKYSKLGENQVIYSQAYTKIFNTYMSENLWWMLILVVVAIGIMIPAIIIKSKKNIVIIKNEKLRLATGMIFHPFDACYKIKYLKKGSLPIACVITALFYIITVSKDIYSGFMYVRVDKSDFNALFVLGGTVGLVLLWSIVNWAVCTLFEGKGKFKEIFIVTAYSLVPMLVGYLFFIASSHILPSGTGFAQSVVTVCTIATALLIFVGLIVIHEFSFLKALATVAATIIGIIIVIFIVFMIFIFIQNLFIFIIGLFGEAALR